jgi:hypothetical protein
MDGFQTDKKFESFKIQRPQQVQGEGSVRSFPQSKAAEGSSAAEGLFYEIEYDACPMPGVGKFVLKPQKIEEPEKDEKRELFSQMREIARAHRSTFDNSRFFDPRVQHDNAIIFYKQGKFMKDFTDDYSENKEFSQYFPYYQMMGYEQLRTYFTWRTEVRKGNVADISLSYAFLYLYELLGNIGVRDPQDGLNQLMFFWKAFSAYNKSIDKYVLRWLKDYHIYYELPHSFKDFIDRNNLIRHYPNMVDTQDNFNLFCNISKYDIRKSVFFTDDKVKLITDCFYFVINKLRKIVEHNGMNFDELIFQGKKKMSDWKPFKDALFYQWRKQTDRRIVLSEKEIFICSNNKWTFSTVITSENGRQLIGYIMKQMEVTLRKVTKYKFKLSANMESVTHEIISKLKEADLSLETIVNDAVAEFYKEATKTVIIVDQVALSRIRQEAFDTQEKLIVPEQENQFTPVIPPIQEQRTLSFTAMQDKPSMPLPETLPTPVDDTWESLKNTLTEIEINALSVVLLGETELKKYADKCGIMLEVLVDGINEKAMDFIGDNLLDEEFAIYDDYKKQVKEMIG